MSSTGPKTQLPRYHSIDSLRAVTMLLVLVFHAAIIYLPFDTDRVLYQDAMRSPFTGWLVLFTRLFHMPVFFLVSGFFAAFLYDTRGAKAFLRHRLKRIGIPLVGSFLVLYPLMAAGYLYTKLLTGDAPLDVERELRSFVQIWGLDLWHLWFLYQLLILCVAAAAIMPLIRLVPEGTRDRLLDIFKGTVYRWWGVALWAAIGFLTLYLPSGIFLYDIDTSLLPPWWMLVGNGVFVAFGWLVYKRREVLEGFKSHAWGYFIAGFIGHGVYLYLGFLKGSTQVVMFMLDTIGLQVGADAVERSAQMLTTACLGPHGLFAGFWPPRDIPALLRERKRLLALHSGRFVLDLSRPCARNRRAGTAHVLLGTSRPVEILPLSGRDHGHNDAYVPLLRAGDLHWRNAQWPALSAGSTVAGVSDTSILILSPFRVP